MALFALNRLSFGYPQAVAPVFHETSFAFEAGERLGFYGPNGSGKSTFFLLVTGLLKSEAGQVLFHDQPIATEKEFRLLRRELGLVLQNAEDQLFHPTVLEDLAFGPLNLGLQPAAARERAERTLDSLGLSHLATRLTHQLSGGEKRLIALAAMLTMQPKVLLLDEPTNDLDPAHQKKLVQILHQLDLGWIVISHDFDFLRQCCTGFMTIADCQLVRSNQDHLHQHFHAHPLGETPHCHE